jgi:hypothetical protein
MKKYCIIIFGAFFLICCSKKQKIVESKLTLELVNKEINYVEIDSNLLLRSENKTFVELKSYTIDERKKAYNELTFRIKNSTNKKYLFALQTDNFEFTGNLNDFKKYAIGKGYNLSNIFFNIESVRNKKSNILKTSFFKDLGKNDSLTIYLKKYQDIQKSIFKDLTIPINIVNYEDYGNEPSPERLFVIYPGEYKTFKKRFYLPILLEKDHNEKLEFEALIIPPNESYNFSLALFSEKQFILRTLHDYQKKEIKDNGYEIFDGILVSNSVPLKLRK